MAGKFELFEFQWKIENFDRCLPWMKLKSPSFVVDSWDKTRWHLVLRFRGDLDPMPIIFELCRENDGVALIIDLEYELSFLDKDGEHFAKQTSKGLFSAGNIAGFSKFLELSEVFGLKKDDLLSDGTLTACCLMGRLEDDSSEYTLCVGRSRLGLERSSHLWLVEDFCAILPGQTKTLLVRTTSKNVPSISIVLFLDDDGDSIRIEIDEDDNCESNTCRCEMTLVDAEGNAAFSKQDRNWFRSCRKSKQVWKFPVFLRKSELVANRKLYLPDDTLKLRCEWKIDPGIAYSRIESCTKYLHSEMRSTMITMDPIGYDE
ncbi:hypothetical protein AVEN_149405-1 [Araneus ventricosus]|uniref:MATH domain-containing protein n=1 Tax=Araneus ventricosus TaxID=182803 RepID=A0A4Y2JJI6_ARAVE|nr:hypothetical protein AVEN_149405-1 [Araneus ventricosus]